MIKSNDEDFSCKLNFREIFICDISKKGLER